jgi:hypothetical protein
VLPASSALKTRACRHFTAAWCSHRKGCG